MDIGQGDIGGLGIDSQSFMIDPHQMQDGGIEIMDMDTVLYRLYPNSSVFSVGYPGLIPAPAIQIVKHRG